MLTYKAMYKFLDEGVHAEVLDFPGAITFGADLHEARRMLASALVDLAETNLLRGEPLPQPNPDCTDPEADLEEPIHLMLTAASRVALVPRISPHETAADLMRRSFSLEYWIDDGWFVGRLKEIPGVFSQGETLEELEENIRDAYLAMAADKVEDVPEGVQSKEIEIEV